MRICVVGLGYIGFPTACLLARAGHEVLGVDSNPAILDELRQGQIHIANESNLAEIAHSVLTSGGLKVAATPAESDAFILCVPTPFEERSAEVAHADVRREVAVAAQPGAIMADGMLEALPIADLRFVVAATRSIAPHVRPGNLVVLESTVPPGTTEHVVLPILAEYGLGPEEIGIAHAPERVLPGAIVHEMVRNDRIVGGMTPEATKAARDLYASFVEGEILTTDATTAEFTKLVENAYRDVNIAFANELARVSRHIGVDVGEVIALANHHPRVRILQPGPGVGGHCIAVDPYFIIQEAQDLTPLLRAARGVNRSMPMEVVQSIVRLVPDGGRVAVLGVAYKGNVGDDRESPSLEVGKLLTERGYSVALHDPYVSQHTGRLEDTVRSADLIAILTDHDVYRRLEPSSFVGLVRHPVLLDTRRLVDPTVWQECGFEVHWLGDGRGLGKARYDSKARKHLSPSSGTGPLRYPGAKCNNELP